MHGACGTWPRAASPGLLPGQGIGIHRGPLLLAVLGDDVKRESTAVGDDANIAARIQDLCKKVGASTLVSEDIVSRVGTIPGVELEDQGYWEVKGRKQKVRVFAVRETPG